MKINIIPQRNDLQYDFYKQGEVFTISYANGDPDLVIDMSVIQEPNYPQIGEGEDAVPGGWPHGFYHLGTAFISGRVKRINGELEFTVLYPVGYGEGQIIPDPLIDPVDGYLPFPDRVDSLVVTPDA